MEAIKAKAIRTKSGKYKISLPISTQAEEVEVMVIVNQKKEESKKTFADFAGKLEWKGDPVKYQKKIRDEWH